MTDRERTMNDSGEAPNSMIHLDNREPGWRVCVHTYGCGRRQIKMVMIQKGIIRNNYGDVNNSRLIQGFAHLLRK